MRKQGYLLFMVLAISSIACFNNDGASQMAVQGSQSNLEEAMAFAAADVVEAVISAPLEEIAAVVTDVVASSDGGAAVAAAESAPLEGGAAVVADVVASSDGGAVVAAAESAPLEGAAAVVAEAFASSDGAEEGLPLAFVSDSEPSVLNSQRVCQFGKDHLADGFSLPSGPDIFIPGNQNDQQEWEYIPQILLRKKRLPPDSGFWSSTGHGLSGNHLLYSRRNKWREPSEIPDLAGLQPDSGPEKSHLKMAVLSYDYIISGDYRDWCDNFSKNIRKCEVYVVYGGERVEEEKYQGDLIARIYFDGKLLDFSGCSENGAGMALSGRFEAQDNTVLKKFEE